MTQQSSDAAGLYPCDQLPHFSLNSFFSRLPHPPKSTLFPYTTLFRSFEGRPSWRAILGFYIVGVLVSAAIAAETSTRSEEHTSELQSRGHLVCRLLLEKKKNGESTRAADNQLE